MASALPKMRFDWAECMATRSWRPVRQGLSKWHLARAFLRRAAATLDSPGRDYERLQVCNVGEGEVLQGFRDPGFCQDVLQPIAIHVHQQCMFGGLV